MEIKVEKYIYCPTCKNTLTAKNDKGEDVLVCNSCGFVFWNNPKPVVSAVISNEGKILTLKRAKEPFKGFWVLPGGFMRHDETPEQAVVRETKEESNLDFSIRDLIGVYTIDDDPRGKHIDIIYSGVHTGDVKLSSEDVEYDFFGTQNLPDKIAYKHRNAINDWVNKQTA